MNSTLPLVVNSGFPPDGLATAALLDDEQDIARHAVCPMCHASATVTQSAIEACGDWRCVRCGQHWDARRLATVAAYAEGGHRERVGRRVMEGDHIAVTFGDAAVEPVDGRP
jgi:ribosomal protein L37AE/L43A